LNYPPFDQPEEPFSCLKIEKEVEEAGKKTGVGRYQLDPLLF
jgi:hypothetical protein